MASVGLQARQVPDRRCAAAALAGLAALTALGGSIAQETDCDPSRDAASPAANDIPHPMKPLPEYPLHTEVREGWVRVRFTITETGHVKDVVVVESEPGEIFDAAALRAVERWRFQPKIVCGVAVEQVDEERTLEFRLEE